jgi:hypothetical protein
LCTGEKRAASICTLLKKQIPRQIRYISLKLKWSQKDY